MGGRRVGRFGVPGPRRPGALFAATAACAVLTAGCMDRGPRGEAFTAARGGFIPEGVEYDAARQRFLVGSLREGTVFVFGRDGSLTPLVSDPELKSSVGIESAVFQTVNLEPPRTYFFPSGLTVNMASLVVRMDGLSDSNSRRWLASDSNSIQPNPTQPP